MEDENKKDIEDDEDDNPIFKSAVSLISEISNTIIGTEISRMTDSLSYKRDLEKAADGFIEEIKKARALNPEDRCKCINNKLYVKNILIYYLNKIYKSKIINLS